MEASEKTAPRSRARFYCIIVCLLFGLACAIVLPQIRSGIETARANSCICNLRLIDGAKQSWALDHKKTNTDIPTWADLMPYLGDDLPKCPSGGSYTVESVEIKPSCTIPGHALP